LKYYKIKDEIIEYVKDIILDILPVKNLNKLCKALNIIINLSYVDDKGISHTPKKYGRVKNKNISNIDKNILAIILMFNHYMPNIILNKSDNILTKKTIKLSSFIANLFRKNLLYRLPMKYCKTNNISFDNLNISDYNCVKFSKFKAFFGNMKDSYNLIETLLKGPYTYHGSLKKFIKCVSYSQILFHKKCNINESIVELDVNSLYA
jgi:hypothetical protein